MSRENQVFFLLMSSYITRVSIISHLIWDSKRNYSQSCNKYKNIFQREENKIETQREHSILITFLE